MPTPNIDLTALIAEVERTKGIQASAKVLIEGIGPQIVAAVTAALEADDAADQGSVEAAVAAINTEIAGLAASSTELGNAIAAHQSPTR